MEIRGINEHDYLILKLNEKSKKFEDITNQVVYINENYNYYYVVFFGKDKNRDYKISNEKIKVGINPTKVVFQNKKIYINNKVSNDLKYIYYFQTLGYKLIFDKQRSLFIEKIKIENEKIEINLLDVNIKYTNNIIFDYYKSLSEYAGYLKKDENSVETLMSRLYFMVKEVSKDSVLDYYTNEKSKKNNFNIEKVIYPFYTNLSQINALNKTFTNKLSVISGPP